MSSLTISVLLLAAIAIVVVAGYNIWLARRRAPRARAPAAAASGAKAAPAGDRAEPSLGLDPVDGEVETAVDHAAQAPSATHRSGGSLLDPYTDCIVELLPAAPVGGERLMALARGLRRAGGKPITLEAREALGDDGSQAQAPEWRAPVGGASYAGVRVGVLLANRHGALNAMEFSEFVGGVQTLADQLSVLADTPDMGAVLARARALDELCASLDAQVGIGVESHDPLGVSDLARLAIETGCVERGNNRYARLGPGGEVLFSLALADSPNRLSLLLDVPRAPAAQAPWREMVACARLCAQRLGGFLVDDAGRPLADTQLERIEQQIAARLQSLDDAGFPAGAPLTLRLFN